MISSIIYKEFIKTHKVMYIGLALLAYCFLKTYLDAKNALEFYNATSTILGISQMGKFDFNYLKYICFIFAIALGVAQYLPEVFQARIRLYFHLPMTSFKLISIMILSGVLVLFVFFTLISLFYYWILTAYYPIEVFTAIYSKLIPLFLSSILCYLAVLLAFIEPLIKKKLLYLSIAIVWINVLFLSSQSSYYTAYLINIVLGIFIFAYLITAYEVFNSYKKGYIK